MTAGCFGTIRWFPFGAFRQNTDEKSMDGREFTKVMGGVVAGLVAGSRGLAIAEEKKAADKKADSNICKGHNECKGKGGCKTDKNACAGKNECKGKGGCAAKAAQHECAGKNGCKGQGGCAGPVKADHLGAKDKQACKGKDGCKGR